MWDTVWSAVQTRIKRQNSEEAALCLKLGIFEQQVFERNSKKRCGTPVLTSKCLVFRCFSSTSLLSHRHRFNILVESLTLGCLGVILSAKQTLKTHFSPKYQCSLISMRLLSPSACPLRRLSWGSNCVWRTSITGRAVASCCRLLENNLSSKCQLFTKWEKQPCFEQGDNAFLR